MSNSDMKRCAISGYKNTVMSGKFFFCSPRGDFATKGLWIHATGKNYSHGSKFFVCEDHFDVSIHQSIFVLRNKTFCLRFTLHVDGNGCRLLRPEW